MPKFSRLRRAKGQLEYPFQNAPPCRASASGTYPLVETQPRANGTRHEPGSARIGRAFRIGPVYVSRYTCNSRDGVNVSCVRARSHPGRARAGADFMARSAARGTVRTAHLSLFGVDRGVHAVRVSSISIVDSNNIS